MGASDGDGDGDGEGDERTLLLCSRISGPGYGMLYTKSPIVLAPSRMGPSPPRHHGNCDHWQYSTVLYSVQYVRVQIRLRVPMGAHVSVCLCAWMRWDVMLCSSGSRFSARFQLPYLAGDPHGSRRTPD